MMLFLQAAGGDATGTLDLKDFKEVFRDFLGLKGAVSTDNASSFCKMLLNFIH